MRGLICTRCPRLKLHISGPLVSAAAFAKETLALRFDHLSVFVRFQFGISRWMLSHLRAVFHLLLECCRLLTNLHMSICSLRHGASMHSMKVGRGNCRGQLQKPPRHRSYRIPWHQQSQSPARHLWLAQLLHRSQAQGGLDIAQAPRTMQHNTPTRWEHPVGLNQRTPVCHIERLLHLHHLLPAVDADRQQCLRTFVGH